MQLIQPAVTRSLERPDYPGLRRSILGRAFSVELHTDAGLYVGRRLGHMVEARRVSRVVEKIVRGLSYHESGAIMPKSHRIGFIVPEHLERIPMEQRGLAMRYISLFENRPLKAGGPGRVFQYAYLEEQQTVGTASLWFLVFFEGFSLLASAVPTEAAA